MRGVNGRAQSLDKPGTILRAPEAEVVPEGGLEDEKVGVVGYLVGGSRAVSAGVSPPPLLSPHTAARVCGLTLTRLDKHQLGLPGQPGTLVCGQVDQDVVIHPEGIVRGEDCTVVLPVRENEDTQSGPATFTENISIETDVSRWTPPTSAGFV